MLARGGLAPTLRVSQGRMAQPGGGLAGGLPDLEKAGGGAGFAEEWSLWVGCTLTRTFMCVVGSGGVVE